MALKFHCAHASKILEVQVRLSDRTALFLLTALTLEGHARASGAQAPSREYVVEAIDGHPLPSILIITGGDTSWIHWGKLSLYAHGKSTYRDSTTFSHRGVRAGGARNTAYAQYRIRGDTIEIGFRPCAAPCFLGYIGRISGSTLTLSWATDPPRKGPLYLYRLTPTR